MQRWLLPMACVLVMAMCATLRGDDGMTNEQALELLRQYNAMQQQVKTMEEQVVRLKGQLGEQLKQNELLREQLVRRGVDVEELLSPPPKESDELPAPDLIFESPEALAGYIRENFSQRIRDDMTQLQREAAGKDFNRWLDSAGLLVTQVSWVIKVQDVWRASKPEDVILHYASDREAMVKQVATLGRSMTPLEMLEMQVYRLKQMQKDRQAIYKQRIDEMAKAKPERKQLAEKIMKQAYGDLVKVNEKLRSAEVKFNAQKRVTNPKAPTTQPEDNLRILIHGRGARDQTVALTLFANEQDAERLMAAPRGSLIKVRGWLTDIALGENVASVGLRLDRCDVLAVNVETPPPPPAPADTPLESGEPTP